MIVFSFSEATVSGADFIKNPLGSAEMPFLNAVLLILPLPLLTPALLLSQKTCWTFSVSTVQSLFKELSRLCFFTRRILSWAPFSFYETNFTHEKLAIANVKRCSTLKQFLAFNNRRVRDSFSFNWLEDGTQNWEQSCVSSTQKRICQHHRVQEIHCIGLRPLLSSQLHKR